MRAFAGERFLAANLWLRRDELVGGSENEAEKVRRPPSSRGSKKVVGYKEAGSLSHDFWLDRLEAYLTS